MLNKLALTYRNLSNCKHFKLILVKIVIALSVMLPESEILLEALHVIAITYFKCEESFMSWDKEWRLSMPKRTVLILKAGVRNLPERQFRRAVSRWGIRIMRRLWPNGEAPVYRYWYL